MKGPLSHVQFPRLRGPVPFTPDKWRPDLFEPLGRAEREGLVNNLAVNWCEDWVPNREDVEDRLALRGGATSLNEFVRRYRTLVLPVAAIYGAKPRLTPVFISERPG